MKPEAARTGVLVWDLPARVCHWGFALSLGASLWIAFRNDPRDDLFKYHMPLGSLALWFLAIRIALGFCGSPLSRWRSFAHAPRAIFDYFAGVFRWRVHEPPGLNPGTSLFAPAVYLCAIGMIVTGFKADWVEAWHGRIAWSAVALIAAHLAGLGLHASRHRALTPLAMIHGRRHASDVDAATKSNLRVGLALVLVSGTLAVAAVLCFDPATSTLHIPGLPDLEFPLIQKG